MNIDDVLNIFDDRKNELNGKYKREYTLDSRIRLKELETIRRRITNYKKASESDARQIQRRSKPLPKITRYNPTQIRGLLLNIKEALDG